jgi:hypothetical protein
MSYALPQIRDEIPLPDAPRDEIRDEIQPPRDEMRDETPVDSLYPRIIAAATGHPTS